jgi:hypothetical protein
MVARATAHISIEEMPNGLPIKTAILRDQLQCAKDKTGCAISALKRMIFVECPLKRVQHTILRKAFDCQNFRAFGLDR